MKTLRKILALLLVLLFSSSLFANNKVNFDDNLFTAVEINEAEPETEKNEPIQYDPDAIVQIPEDERDLYSQEDKDKKKKKKKSFWHRTFEIGLDVDAGVSNNYFHLDDILTETININFNEISENISENGLGLNVGLDARFFMDLNTSKFSASLFANADAIVNVALHKNLIDFIAKGNTIDTDFGVGAGVGGSVFAEAGLGVEIPFGKLKIKAVPAYYIPLVYLPYTPADVTAVTKNNGQITATGKANATLYSALPLNDFSKIDVSSIMKQGGFDISVYGSYQLFSFLDVGAFLTCIPIVPANVGSAFKYDAALDFSMEAILNQLKETGSVDMSNFTYSLSENLASPDDKQIVVRPFRFGFDATWRVFGNKYLVIDPMIQFKFADFTLENKAGFGFDYAFTVYSDLGFFVPSFTTSYLDSIFSQQLRIALNLKILELDIVASTQSANFAQSFMGSGFGVGVGFRIGF